jgi:hypothetical protein
LEQDPRLQEIDDEYQIRLLQWLIYAERGS